MGEMHFSASEYDALERMYNATYLDFLARGERIREVRAALREAIEYIELDSEYPADFVDRLRRALTGGPTP